MKTIHVLVAEDNDDHRFLTMRSLRSYPDVNLEVAGVRDGAETLDFVYGRGEFADRPRPDLVILDLKMPKVGGLEVLQQLKSDPATSAIPIVVLSSSDAVADVDAAYATGTNSYMTKPATTGSFREQMHCIATYWADRSQLPSSPA